MILETAAPKTAKPKSKPKIFKATMPVSAVKSALSTLKRDIVSSSVTIPILACVLVEAKGGKVSISGTDLDNTLTFDLPAESVAPGALCVDAARLLKIVSAADGDGQVALEQGKDGEVSVSTSGVKYKLPSLPAVDWPSSTFEADISFKVDGTDFRRLFTKTAFAISTEETRYYLNGVYLHTRDDKTLTGVATDGHRLAMAHMGLPSGAENLSGMIVPRKTCRVIRKIAKGGIRVDISNDSLKMRLSGTGWRMSSKMIDGQFPDYTRVIPHKNKLHGTVDAGALSKMVKRVLAVSDQNSVAVKMVWTHDDLALSHNSFNTSIAETSIPAIFSKNDKIKIGFNGRYLLEMLAQIDGENVMIEMEEPGDPTVFRDPTDDSALYVIMPMRT